MDWFKIGKGVCEGCILSLWLFDLQCSVQFRSVTQLYQIFCNSMDCSTPGFSVHHQFPELPQTHVHRVGDVIPPSHPLLSPSPPAFNLSQHWSFPMSQFFPSSGQSIWASDSVLVLTMNIQACFPLGFTDLISLQFQGLSRVFSNTTVQKHQFFSAQLSIWSSFHIYTWLLEKPYLWLDGPLLAK